jgi:hypothetical protein
MSYAEIYDTFIEGMYELDSAIDEYIPISEYATVFEADNPDVQKTAESNEKASVKGDNAILKILKAIKKIIVNVITSIRNFFDKARLSAEQKKLYEAFKEECAKNPSFKNKKVTVRDWQEIEKRGAELHAQGEKLLREESENPTACETFANKAAEFCKDTAKSVGASVAVDTAMRYMEYCPSVADKVLADMNRDSKWCENLEKQIGSKGMKKFEKYANKMRTRTSIGMWLARIGKARYDSLSDATAASMKGVKNLLTGKLVDRDSIHLVSTLTSNKKVGGVATSVMKNAGKQVVKDKFKAATAFATKGGRYAKARYDLDNMKQGDRETDREFARRVEKQKNKVSKLENKRYKEYKKDRYHRNSGTAKALEFLSYLPK